MSDSTVRVPLPEEPRRIGSANRPPLALLLADQRQRWQRGERVRVEDYYERDPGVRADAEAILQLIYNEVILREEQGEVPQLAEYVQRFPDLADPLRLQFEVDQAIQSGQLFRSALKQTEAASGPSGASLPGSRTCTSPATQVNVPNYEILGVLGQGAMGIVYQAWQMNLRRLVALKMVRAGSLTDREMLARFRIEAEAAARLQHPNIVQIYEVGEHAGRPYLALEYVDGGSLAEHLDGTPLPAQQVATLLEVLARAMDHAHQRGIVHRDLKPGNILLQSLFTAGDAEERRGNPAAKLPLRSSVSAAVHDSTPKITDFGLAKLLVGGDESQTLTGSILGTPSYMAPEQASGKTKETVPATDVYALGAILYELLTGRPPFRGESRLATLEQIRSQEPVPPRSLQPRLPHDLETICLKCLQKEPGKRYATAAALAEDLRRFQAGEPILARPTSWVERAASWCRRNPAVSALAGSVALLLILVTVVSVLSAVWQRQARQEILDKLWWSYLGQAKANRTSRRVGQRFNSLEMLTKAAQIAREQGMPEERLRELRNEAIACLALPDLRLTRQPGSLPPDSFSIDLDGTLEKYARVDLRGGVTIHRVADNVEIGQLPGLGSSAFVVLSRDGQFLALQREASLRSQVWKLAGPKPVVVIDEPTGLTLDFSSDSRQAVVGQRDGTISWYDLDSGQRLRQLATGRLPRHLAVHPKEPQVAVCGDKVVRIRSLETGRVLAELGHETGIYNVAWHPGGHQVATAGEDNRIYLWDVPAQRQTAVLEGHKSGGIQLAFSHSGDLLASGGWENTLRLWDTQTGKQVFSTQAATGCLRFQPDDRQLAAAIRGNELGLWEIALSREYRTLVRPLMHGSESHHGCAFSADGRLLAAGMKDGVAFWDLTQGTALAFTRLNFAGSILFDPSGALLTNGGDGVLRWPVQADAATGGLHFGPPSPLPLRGSACQIARSRDGRVLAIASQNKGGLVLHTERPHHPIRLVPHEDVRYIAVEPQGRLVATGSQGRSPMVKVWDANSGQLVKELPASGGSSVNFSPDGRWLATGGGGCRLWKVDSWHEGPVLGGEGGSLMAFSPDARLLAVETGSGVVRLVDPNTGEEYARLEDPDQDRAFWIGFSPDGTHLVTTSFDRQLVHVWDLRLLREDLSALGLDWNLPKYPPAQGQADRLLHVAVDRGSLPPPPQLDLVRYGLAIVLNPINPEAYLRRGRAYARLQDAGVQERQKAIADYTMFLALVPSDDKRCAEVLFRRANNHYLLDHRADWLADMLQVVQLNLDGIPEIHDDIARQCNYLAWQLVMGPEKERDAAKALPLAKKAHELTPGEWMYLNTLGAVQYRLGHYTAAVDTLEQSIHASQKEPTAFDLFFLAMCQHQLGDVSKAKDHYDRAVAWWTVNRSRLPADQIEDLTAIRAEAAQGLKVADIPGR
jgi:serine/threonine protein kinase/WD40 repeat protein